MYRAYLVIRREVGGLYDFGQGERERERENKYASFTKL
jgi:hypothetical protein